MPQLRFQNPTAQAWLLLSLFYIALLEPCLVLGNANRLNVLLFIVDDLRPEIGSYLSPQHPLFGFTSFTPHIDRFAKSSLQFNLAFANYPNCNPSRASMLTGIRPENLGLFNKDPLSKVPTKTGRYVTLPQAFRSQGYFVAGAGKVFHHERASDFDSFLTLNPQNEGFCIGKPVCEVTDETELVDYKSASFGVNFLRARRVDAQAPFLLIIGFSRPHVAFSYPVRSKLPLSQVDILDQALETPHGDFWRPDGFPASRCLTLQADDIPAFALPVPFPKCRINLSKTAFDRSSYYGCVRWIDEAFGRVMDELDSSPKLVKNTIVAFVSDNGFHLYENGYFGKSTPYEASAQVPFFLRAPQFPHSYGKTTSSMAELSDLGTTLVDLAYNGTFGRDGNSLQPAIASLVPQKFFSVTLNTRCAMGSGRITPQTKFEACEMNRKVKIGKASMFVYSLRTPTHRYVEYRQALKNSRNFIYKTNWATTGLWFRSLFAFDGNNHNGMNLDAGKFESKNIAPCKSCAAGQAPTRANITDLFGLGFLQGDLQEENYVPPELGQLPKTTAWIIARLSLVLRSFSRDGILPCSGHGLPVTVGTAECECFVPWSGPQCDVLVGLE